MFKWLMVSVMALVLFTSGCASTGALGGRGGPEAPDYTLCVVNKTIFHYAVYLEGYGARVANLRSNDYKKVNVLNKIGPRSARVVVSQLAGQDFVTHHTMSPGYEDWKLVLNSNANPNLDMIALQPMRPGEKCGMNMRQD